MLSLGQGAWADQATVPMPHARRVYHGGQFETTRACGLSDGLIKFFTSHTSGALAEDRVR